MCDLTFLFFYEFILVESLHRKKVLISIQLYGWRSFVVYIIELIFDIWRTNDVLS